jgi:hypothetical protein
MILLQTQMSTVSYHLYKDVAQPGDGNHYTYFFVNISLGTPDNLFCNSGEVIPLADAHLYTDQELTFLEAMQDRNVFSSSNGPCITVVRVNNVSDFEPYDVDME